jgi:hypothetical protein
MQSGKQPLIYRLRCGFDDLYRGEFEPFPGCNQTIGSFGMPQPLLVQHEGWVFDRQYSHGDYFATGGVPVPSIYPIHRANL